MLEQIQSLCVVLGTIMTERCRSSCTTYSFSHGKAIPSPHLENVCHGYLMHFVTLWQGDPRPVHHRTAALWIMHTNTLTACCQIRMQFLLIAHMGFRMFCVQVTVCRGQYACKESTPTHTHTHSLTGNKHQKCSKRHLIKTQICIFPILR